MPITTFHIRTLIGLSQGLVLYGLYHANQSSNWLTQRPMLMAPLLLLATLLPPLAQTALVTLRATRLLGWLGILGIALIVLGVYDRWRIDIGTPLPPPDAGLPEVGTCLAAAALLFIAWSMILAGEHEHRFRASYPAYFDAAWKFSLQLAFSLLFVGVFWLVLETGAGLFELIKIDSLQQLIARSWFAIPSSALALSAGLHLTDIRPGIIHGFRSLLLTLLSWLLPLLTLLVIGFLLALPFTGLAVLWQTRHAAGGLLATAVFLIVLLNAAYQEGDDRPHGRSMKTTIRIACWLLLPVTALAGQALSMRIMQYGWSPERVAAMACILVSACYAIGYAIAALERHAWLATLAQTNVFTSWLIMALLLALCSPLADPVKISVASQLHRLHTGAITPEKFDYAFLRLHGLRYGHAALRSLKTDANLPETVRRQAGNILAGQSPHEVKTLETVIHLQGQQPLPNGFLTQDWHDTGWPLPSCLRDRKAYCNAYVGHFTGAGNPEVLLSEFPLHHVYLFQRNDNQHWQLTATYDVQGDCQSRLANIRPEQIQPQAPQLPDLDIAGVRLRPNYIQPLRDCAIQAPRSPHESAYRNRGAFTSETDRSAAPRIARS